MVRADCHAVSQFRKLGSETWGEGVCNEVYRGLTPRSSEVSMRSWSFMERRSLSFMPAGASASSIRWVWSGSTGGAGFAPSSA